MRQTCCRFVYLSVSVDLSVYSPRPLIFLGLCVLRTLCCLSYIPPLIFVMRLMKLPCSLFAAPPPIFRALRGPCSTEGQLAVSSFQNFLCKL
jgi:hypothetical protein